MSSQWETALLCSDVSHWLGANLGPVLIFQPTIHQAHHEADPLWFSALVHLFSHKTKWKALRTPALRCLWSRQPTGHLYLDITAFLSVGEIATPVRIPYALEPRGLLDKYVLLHLRNNPLRSRTLPQTSCDTRMASFTVPVHYPYGLFMKCPARRENRAAPCVSACILWCDTVCVCVYFGLTRHNK